MHSVPPTRGSARATKDGAPVGHAANPAASIRRYANSSERAWHKDRDTQFPDCANWRATCPIVEPARGVRRPVAEPTIGHAGANRALGALLSTAETRARRRLHRRPATRKREFPTRATCRASRLLGTRPKRT